MKSKKLFLSGVFLLAAFLTSLGTPSFAYDVRIYGIDMKELRNGFFLTD